MNNKQKESLKETLQLLKAKKESVVSRLSSLNEQLVALKQEKDLLMQKKQSIITDLQLLKEGL